MKRSFMDPIERTGRRFGYIPSGGLFSHVGYLFVPNDSELLATILGDQQPTSDIPKIPQTFER